MILHRLVDVEASRRRSVESGQEHVDDDKKLHLAGVVNEAFLHLLLELVHLMHRSIFRLIEVRREHCAIDVILPLLFSFPFAGLLAPDVRYRRPVGGHDGALACQRCPLKHFEEAAGRVDVRGHENCVALVALQTDTGFHVQEDVGDDLAQAILRTQDVPHRGPPLSQLVLCEIGQSLSLAFEPLVDLVLRRDSLINVTRLVTQIEHHSVAYGLVVLVGVDIWTERLDAALLVVLEEGCPGEADQHGVRQQGLHGAVKFSGLGPMALVHEDEDFARRVETAWEAAPDFPDVGLEFLITDLVGSTEFVNQRADQPLLACVQRTYQILAAPGSVDVFADAVEDLLDLFVEFGAIGNDQDSPIQHILANPLREPDHRQALAAALGMPDDATLAAFHLGLRRLDAEILVVAAGLLDA